CTGNESSGPGPVELPPGTGNFQCSLSWRKCSEASCGVQDGESFNSPSRKLVDAYQESFAFLPACQRSKSAPRMKNFRPIWTIRMRSSSMILRKCRTEKPASSAALGMSRNVLFVVHSSVDFILVLLYGGRICSRNATLLFGHKRVPIVGRRYEIFLDCAGAHPAKQVHHRARLVVRPAGARSTEGLLPDDGSRGLVVHVEIAGREPKDTMSVGDRHSVGRKNAACQSIWRRAVHNPQNFIPLLFGVNVQGHDRPEEFFAHGAIIGPFRLDQGRPDEIAGRIVGFTPRDDLGLIRSPRLVQIPCQFFE